MNRYIDLRSDLLSQPNELIIEAITKASNERLYFGLREDPYQIDLEKKIAKLTGKEDALFFPTCTMANQAAIILLSSPGDCIVTLPSAHIFTSEAGAPAALAGLLVKSFPGVNPLVPLDDWQSVLENNSDLAAPISILAMENTHTRSGGTVLPPDYVRAVLEIALFNGIKAHLDGARIFNAACALKIPVKDLCNGFDTVSLSLNKGLGAPIGAMLAGSKAAIKNALRIRQRLGGGIRPSSLLTAAGVAALDGKHIYEDHKRASDLANGLAKLPSIQIKSPSPLTNIVLVDISATNMTTTKFCSLLDDRKILALPFSESLVRMVTYRGISDADILKVIKVFSDLISTIYDH